MDTVNYIELLNKNYASDVEFDPDLTKLEFLDESVFGFTTDDSDMSEYFAEKAVKICGIILNRDSFDFIKDKENYLLYLTMVNMPFFADKLEYGRSIRGAWFHTDTSCTIRRILDSDEKPIVINTDNLRDFIRAVIAFAENE